MGDRRGTCLSHALASSSTLPPDKKFDGDKVPSSNHTHAKVWLIKCHFCKTTQISVIVLAFPNIKKRANLWLSLRIQKPKQSLDTCLLYPSCLAKMTFLWWPSDVKFCWHWAHKSVRGFCTTTCGDVFRQQRLMYVSDTRRLPLFLHALHYIKSLVMATFYYVVYSPKDELC